MITFSPLTSENIKVGIRVKCTYKDHYLFGSDATISEIRSNGSFMVSWDTAQPGEWQTHSYFKIIVENKRSVKRRAKNLLKSNKILDIPLDPDLPVLMAGYLQDRERKRL
jgi:hypothetical protein